MWGKGLRKVLRSIWKASYLDKKAIKRFVKDLRKALASSDVEVKLNLDLCNKVKERALNEEPLPGLTRREQLVNIVYEELTKLVGPEEPEIPIHKQKILLVGLFGQGKSTSAVKLAKFFSKRGLSVGLATTDIHRPAAYEQLKQLGEEAGMPVFDSRDYQSAKMILIDFLSKFSSKDVLIVDSAGRDMLNDELKREIKVVSEVLDPEEKLLVLGADLGQDAGEFARKFDQAVGLTGVLITKLDTTAKAGGALSAVARTGAQIKFIGTGEKLTDLEVFDPRKYIQRVLGMGDLERLIEKVKEAGIGTKGTKEPEKVLEEFSLETFLDQMGALDQMGSLKKILPMVGMVDLPDQVLKISKKKMTRWKAAILSMTPQERKDPSIISSSRVRRIASGSGTSTGEVRELLRQFKQAKKLMTSLKKGRISPQKIRKIMKRFR